MATPALRNSHPAKTKPRCSLDWLQIVANRRRGSAGFTMDYAQKLINRYFSSSAVDI
jgi:hypothetical protein